MQTWEYKVVTLELKIWRQNGALEKQLNEYGAQGWELVKFAKHDAALKHYAQLVFKKRRGE